ELSLALAALDRFTALRDEDELVEQRFEPLVREAESREPVAQARDVAVMVGTEDRDQPIVTTCDLVGEVREVGREIRPASVALADDAFLVLESAVGGLEEERAVLLDEVTGVLQLAHDDRGGPPAIERLL